MQGEIKTVGDIKLFVKDGCHLCEQAIDVVDAVCVQNGVAWQKITLTESDPDFGKYAEYFPVLEVHGVWQGFWRIDPKRLTHILERLVRESKDG